MVVGLLFGAETDIDVEVSHTHETANEYMYTDTKTNIYSPTISPTYSMVHNPILQFNSPHGSIGGSPVSLAPETVGTHVTTAISPSQTVEQLAETAQAGGGNGGIMDYIVVIGIVIVGALIVLPMLLKKKVKAKATTPTGIGGSVDT